MTSDSPDPLLSLTVLQDRQQGRPERRRDGDLEPTAPPELRSTAMTHPTIIYKILAAALWAEAQSQGELRGAPIDLADGYIHFSTESQMHETARKFFAGQRDLLLVAVDTTRLGPKLRWEPSRGGELFPHLYAPLKLDAVVWARPLPLDPSGTHQFPPLDK